MNDLKNIRRAELTVTEQMLGLIRRAQNGDRSVLPQLRKAIDEEPSLWSTYGDLALQSQTAWLNLIAGQDLLLSECVQRQLASLREDLAGSDPSPLERLLVERVAACWLQCHYADALFAQSASQADGAMRQELLKRQESAQKRYLASLKQLALVRKLLRPAVSPLQMAMSTVAETSAPRRERGATVCRDGVPVLN